MKPINKSVAFLFISFIPLLFMIACGSNNPYYTRHRTSLEQPEVVYKTPSIALNEDQITKNVEDKVRDKLLNGWRPPGATNQVPGASSTTNLQPYGNAPLPSRPYYCDPTFFPNMNQSVNACRLFENQFAKNVGFRTDPQAFNYNPLTYPLTPNVVHGVTDTPGPWPPTGGPFLNFDNLFPNGPMGVPGILDGPFDDGDDDGDDDGNCGGCPDGSCRRRGPSGLFKGNVFDDACDNNDDDGDDDGCCANDRGDDGARDSDFRGPWQFFGPRLFGGEWAAPLFGFDDDVAAFSANPGFHTDSFQKGKHKKGSKQSRKSNGSQRNNHKSKKRGNT